MHLRQGRSSHRSCSMKVVFLKNFAIFKGNHLCWSLYLIKLQVFRPAALLIQVFSYEYCEILKTPVLKISCVRLLLTRHTSNICFLFYPDQTFLRLDFSLFSLKGFDDVLKRAFLISSLRLALLISSIHFFINN